MGSGLQGPPFHLRVYNYRPTRKLLILDSLAYEQEKDGLAKAHSEKP